MNNTIINLMRERSNLLINVDDEISNNERKLKEFEETGDINDFINHNTLIDSVLRVSEIHKEVYSLLDGQMDQFNLYKELTDCIDSEKFERAAELLKLIDK